MKVGLISDIHGNRVAFDRVLSELETENVEKIIFLGDMVGYYPFAEDCMRLWNPQKFVGVRGNHDQVLLDAKNDNGKVPSSYSSQYGHAIERTLQNLSEKSFQILNQLPKTLELEIDGLKIKCIHGAPWDELNGRVYPDFSDWSRFKSIDTDLLLLGHTHYQMEKKMSHLRIVNPGSVGQPRDLSCRAAFGILDSATGSISLKRVAFDASALIDDAKKNDPTVPYLHEVFTK